MKPIRLTVTEKLRNLFLAKGELDWWDIPIEVKPFNCPRCNSRIERRADLWVCVGCKDREEVERYKGPEFPGGEVPIVVQKADPCGWQASVETFGHKWF